MSTWTPLNVIPDEGAGQEVDDTRELQIEEAVRLYQNAIKLHAQGARAYQETEDAYGALFASEIFRYEKPTHQQQGWEEGDYATEGEAGQEGNSEDRLLTLGNAGQRRSGAAPDSVSEILHLAYKNRGYFILDQLRHRLRNASGTETQPEFRDPLIEKVARKAFDDFTEALLRDDTDWTLWRLTSRLAILLGQTRIARYCLEAAVARQSDGYVGDKNPSKMSIEEVLAVEELRRLLEEIGDDTPLSQPLMGQFKGRRLAPELERNFDPYPFLPRSLRSLAKQNPLGAPPQRYTIKVLERTWAAVGKALLHELQTEQQGTNEIPMGAGILISIPEDVSDSAKPNHSAESRKGSDAHGIHELAIEEDALNAPLEGQDRDRSSSGDPAVQVAEVLEASAQGMEQSTKAHTADGDEPTQLPSRKRTSSTAGLPDTNDGGRVRSKRIRARESTAENATTNDKTATDASKDSDRLLETYVERDERLFETVGEFLKRFEADGLGSLRSLQEIAAGDGRQLSESGSMYEDNAGSLDTAVSDLSVALRSWDSVKAQGFSHTQAVGNKGTKPKPAEALSSRKLEFMTLLEQTKTENWKTASISYGPIDQGLGQFRTKINSQWLLITDAASSWLEHFLKSDFEDNHGPSSSLMLAVLKGSSYMRDAWPEDLKETIVQMLVILDAWIYPDLRKKSEEIILQFRSVGRPNYHPPLSGPTLQLMDMIETILELHMDLYSSMKNLNSEVEANACQVEKYRVDRWEMLMDEVMEVYPEIERLKASQDTLALRFIWQQHMFKILPENIPREKVTETMLELKTWFLAFSGPAVKLQNNAFMPEVSAKAAWETLQRGAVFDLLTDIFRTEQVDPVLVTDKLEIILDPSAAGLIVDLPEENTANEIASQHSNIAITINGTQVWLPDFRLAAKFVKAQSVRLRLFLWDTLKDAWEALGSPSEVFRCHLRIIGILMAELTAPSYLKQSRENRQLILLAWLQVINEHLIKATTLAINDHSAFDIIDVDRLKLSARSVASLARLLHVSALFEDALRVGRIQVAESSNSLLKARRMLVDMQIRTWILLYTLLKEATKQINEAFPAPSEDLAEYLHVVHQATGLRKFCNASNKILLRVSKQEIFKTKTVENREMDTLQVLFDLYSLKIGPNSGSLEDHGCYGGEIDRPTAVMIVDFALSIFRRASIKDLSKTEYRLAIERINTFVYPFPKHPSESDVLKFNVGVFKQFMKKSINPRDLYDCVKGFWGMPGKRVPAHYAKVASKGWYFLMGQMALARVRSQKLPSPKSKEDLETAENYFRADLQYNPEMWETWYRLAQTYDSMIEEDVLWTAEKLNYDRNRLNSLQRSAIRCYMTALSYAVRQTQPSIETEEKMSELYTDFGMRMYASSRPPFDMEVFSLKDYQRFFSGAGIYQGNPHLELTEFAAWKFARVMFDKALVHKPSHWINHYMRGKCMWKMFQHAANTTSSETRIADAMDVVNTFVRAIETLPKRRSDKQDPIFEPHYKLVSLTHKLVQKEELEIDEACRILQNTPYARKVDPPPDLDGWEPFMLRILKALRTADKSNWHHRMTARAAHIIYDDVHDFPAAAGARHELTQQIFTKTMVVQVWKPEFERAGRHYVYTSRYTMFFTRLLLQLSDKQAMEALARRVRKKATDFYEHTKVWGEIFEAYIKLLRRAGQTSDNYEDTIIKGISPEEFATKATKLKQWSEDTSTSHPTLDILREAIELKKLNANLVKAGPVDDLIANAFVRLWEDVVPTLTSEHPSTDDSTAKEKKKLNQTTEKRDKMSVDNLLMTTITTTNNNDTDDDVTMTEDTTTTTATAIAGGGAVVVPIMTNTSNTTAAAATARSSRPKYIPKRDIVRKAESIFGNKSTVATTTAAAGAAAASGSASTSSSRRKQQQRERDDTEAEAEVEVVEEEGEGDGANVNADDADADGDGDGDGNGDATEVEADNDIITNDNANVGDGDGNETPQDMGKGMLRCRTQ